MFLIRNSSLQAHKNNTTKITTLGFFMANISEISVEWLAVKVLCRKNREI